MRTRFAVQLRGRRRHRHADRRSRRPAARSASSTSTSTRPRRSARTRGPSARSRMLDARPAPSGRAAGRAEAGRRRRAVPRGVRPRARGRPRRGATRRCSRGRVGELVASPLVTLVDDGTYAREWGTYAIDDEGPPAQRNVLIEDGVLTDYMWDLVRARKEGRRSQRQRPARDLPAPADGADDEHVPARRARTTPTRSSARRPYGLYCVQLGGGQVEHRHRRLRLRDHRGVHDRGRRDHRTRLRRPS